MVYRIKITQGTTVLGQKDISPEKGDEGWLGQIVNEIMNPVRRAADGPIGEYVIKITEVPPGILNA